MSKPRVPNRRSTTWRPTPADDTHAQAITDALRDSHGIETGHTGAMRFALKFTAEALGQRTAGQAPAEAAA